MAKRKMKFAKQAPDVYIMVRYKHRLYKTDYHATDMCRSEVLRIDEKPDGGECYCAMCKKIECVRNCNPVSTTQLWRNINSIIPRI